MPLISLGDGFPQEATTPCRREWCSTHDTRCCTSWDAAPFPLSGCARTRGEGLSAIQGGGKRWLMSWVGLAPLAETAEHSLGACQAFLSTGKT